MLTGQKTDAPGNERDGEPSGAHIVNLHVLVVFPAGDFDAIFGVGELELKPKEVFVGVRFRNVCRDEKQPAERGRQGFLGLSPCRGRRSGGEFAEDIGDAGENVFLVRDTILHGRNQVGNQIRTAPELRIKVRPILIRDFTHGNQTDVLGKEQTDAEKNEHNDGRNDVS